MSKLKSFLAQDVSTWVEFTDIPEFKINLHYLTREELQKIRKGSLVYKLNKATRQKEETIDNDKFLPLYVERAIIGWEGLKVKHLPQLMPADISKANPNDSIEFTLEDAVDLMQNSTVFDQFITDCMADFDTFAKEKQEEDSKN